ncbi:MAG: DUF2157 domain-containing protein, partial [Sphingobacteriales bacterium]
MKIDREQSEFLDETISRWEEEQLLDPATADKLRNSYESKAFDWRRLAQIAFWVAMACGVIGLGALLVDDDILDYFRVPYETPDAVIAALSAIAAGWIFQFAYRRKKKEPQKIFSNEAVTFTAVMLTANAIAYLGKTLGGSSQHFSLLILLSVVVYGILAMVFHSKLIWIFTLLSIGAWFGTETGYLSRGNWYFMGMNYPLRFVFFGLLIVLAGKWMDRGKRMKEFANVTYIAGMAYLFISLWLLSVFGNFGSLESWYNVPQ